MKQEFVSMSGKKIEMLRFYPTSGGFKLHFHGNEYFELESWNSNGELKKFSTKNMNVEGAVVVAETRGRDNGKILGMTKAAYDLLQNSGSAMGDTYNQKAIWKSLGFRWNGETKKWEK